MQDLDFSSAEAFPSLAGAYKNTTVDTFDDASICTCTWLGYLKPTSNK